jgi:hypothetical protein
MSCTVKGFLSSLEVYSVAANALAHAISLRGLKENVPIILLCYVADSWLLAKLFSLEGLI